MFSKSAGSLIYRNMSCESKAVIQQSWRTAELGDKSPWIIFKLLLTQSLKIPRECVTTAHETKPQASQRTAVYILIVYNSLIIWLNFMSENTGDFWQHSRRVVCSNTVPRLQHCWRYKHRTNSSLDLTPFLNAGAGLHQETLEGILVLISMDYGESEAKLGETCKEMLGNVFLFYLGWMLSPLFKSRPWY